MAASEHRQPGTAGRAGVAPLAVLAAVACLLLLPGLGDATLWADEGDTAVFARSIRDHGLPRAWDGRTFTEFDRGMRLTDDLVLVGTPWLPYYLTAASFAVLGESAFAARLPFALCGLAAVLTLFGLVQRATGDRRAALLAALLLLASVQFLLYARQCRHYALHMALVLGVLWSFLRLGRERGDPWLVVLAALLFHTQPLPAVASLGALSGVTLVHPSFRDRRRPFFLRLALVLPLTAPWLLWARAGWSANTVAIGGLGELAARLGQAGLEASAAVPWLGWLVLYPFAWRRLSRDDRDWLFLAGAVIAAYLVLSALALTPWHHSILGLRYTCGVIPLAAGMTAVLATRATRGRTVALAAVGLLFAFTHLPGQTLPWLFAPPQAFALPGGLVVHVPRPGLPRILRSEWLGFARELSQGPERGTVSAIVSFLDREADEDDIVITNYAREPIYFHTGLRLGMTVLPRDPIAAAARARGLPDYVFEVDGADWVVWRYGWSGQFGLRLADLEHTLAEQGRELELVKGVPETLWENRPELHAHRFPGVGLVYPSPLTDPRRRRPAEIHRVVPAGGPAPGSE